MPPGGWEQLWTSKEATKKYLKQHDRGHRSSDEEDIDDEELEGVVYVAAAEEGARAPHGGYLAAREGRETRTAGLTCGA